MKQWKHSYTWTYRSGKTRVVCGPCGEASPWIPTEDQDTIREWCNKHPGRMEKTHRVPPVEPLDAA